MKYIIVDINDETAFATAQEDSADSLSELIKKAYHRGMADAQHRKQNGSSVTDQLRCDTLNMVEQLEDVIQLRKAYTFVRLLFLNGGGKISNEDNDSIFD